MPLESDLSDPNRRPMDDEIDVWGLTHKGKVRQNNEDHFLLCSLKKHIKVYNTSLPDTHALAADERVAFISVVADGVGGRAAGEEASRLALEGITRYVSEAMHVYYTRWDKPQQQYQKRLVRPEVQATLTPELRWLLALDDARNDELSETVAVRSGFLK